MTLPARPQFWSPATDAPGPEVPDTPSSERAAPAAGTPGTPGAPAARKRPRRPAAPEPEEEAAGIPRPRYSPTIKELPADERPRERLYAYGPQALTTAELIGILIRVGTHERSAVSLGEHLLAHFGDNLNVLREQVPDEGVDLINNAPPFNSSRIYFVLFGDRTAKASSRSRSRRPAPSHWGVWAIRRSWAISSRFSRPTKPPTCRPDYQY